MINLADQLREEKALGFDKIKAELTEKVVADIRKYNVSFIHLGSQSDEIHEYNGFNKGWEIDHGFRLAAKEYFLSCGFVVTPCTSPGGNLYGYQIEL